MSFLLLLLHKYYTRGIKRKKIRKRIKVPNRVRRTKGQVGAFAPILVFTNFVGPKM